MQSRTIIFVSDSNLINVQSLTRRYWWEKSLKLINVWRTFTRHLRVAKIFTNQCETKFWGRTLFSHYIPSRRLTFIHKLKRTKVQCLVNPLNVLCQGLDEIVQNSIFDINDSSLRLSMYFFLVKNWVPTLFKIRNSSQWKWHTTKSTISISIHTSIAKRDKITKICQYPGIKTAN